MLHVEDIHTFYGRSYVLQGVSLEISGGELVSLLGRNGAGKTTTLRSIMGLTPPRQGQITFQDEDITGLEPYEISRKGIGYVPEERRIFHHLTVLENLHLAIQEKEGRDSWDLNRVFDTFPRLAERQNNRGGDLSGGERQMLTIARSLMGNPDLLLLDEPTEGLAPTIVNAVVQMIQTIKSEGVTILLVEQNVESALQLVDRHYILDQGMIVFEGETLGQQEKERFLSV